ncbi:HNH endonuclease [Salinicoccus sp. YB14-2]|uniref:HNH endonuclease n=1 Tax=Salinicoccus sp. YB14-2 TaxID=1572701 RepID=UPI00068F510F|nr:HNH endonuclease [Salinicoccus sp. YB14-2]
MKSLELLLNNKEDITRDFETGIEYYFKKNGEKNLEYTQKVPDTNVNILSPAQGIFKQKDSRYAISVKQTLKGSYDDQKPYFFEDGSSIYLYHQRSSMDSKSLEYTHNKMLEDRDSIADNIALNNNLKERVPLGVVIQTTERQGRTKALYSVRSGIVVGWLRGYYIIYCANDDLEINEEVMNLPLGQLFDLPLLPEEDTPDSEDQGFDPADVIDRRKKTLQAIVQRGGQSKFRKLLLHEYGRKCLVSGTDIPQVLEAAHITPYLGDDTDVVENGILLRSDLHTLWDLFLLYIDPETLKVNLADNLKDTEYYHYHGKIIELPGSLNIRNALRHHMSECKNKEWGD